MNDATDFAKGAAAMHARLTSYIEDAEHDGEPPDLTLDDLDTALNFCLTEGLQITTALDVRMAVKRLLQVARIDYPDFDFAGTIDGEDVAIEALIHPELFDTNVRLKEDYL